MTHLPTLHTMPAFLGDHHRCCHDHGPKIDPRRGLGEFLEKIADTLQGVADTLTGEGKKPDTLGEQIERAIEAQRESPFTGLSESDPFARAYAIASGEIDRSRDDKPIAGTGRIWGDPHFIGADGGKYDVQGQAGKTYNLLSDKNFQMNGEFVSLNGSDSQTVVGKVGINAGGNFIETDKSGQTYVNGAELKDGERIDLEGGGTAERDGGVITVKKGEWEISMQTHGDHINIDATTTNAVSDGVKPHGLLGQTFDGDGKARNGDAYSGAQGGGAIESTVGDISEAGDKDAVRNYEVDSLWDINFTRFNRTTGTDTFGYDRAASMGDRSLAILAGATLFSSLFTQSAFSAGFGAGFNYGQNNRFF